MVLRGGGEQRGITRSQCVKGEGGLKEINRPPPITPKIHTFLFCSDSVFAWS